jgi:predicted ATPase with chaperone activity
MGSAESRTYTYFHGDLDMKHFIMGPGGPGTGKSMIASGITSALPPMAMQELDMSKIHGEYVGQTTVSSLKQALEKMPEQIKPVIFNEG